MTRLRPIALFAGLGVALLSGCFGAPSLARAQGNIELGPFRVVPSLTVTGEYNDNIVLAPSNAKSDFIWTIKPGLALKLRTPRYGLNVGYQAEILRYETRSNLDTVRHTAQADAQGEVGDKLSFRLTDEFRRTDDFVGQPVPELTQRVDRNENTLEAGAEYRVRERFSVGLDYRFFLINYLDGASFDELDRKDHFFGVSLFYWVSPKLAVRAQYGYQLVRYDVGSVAGTRDSESQQGFVGLRGDLTAKLSAQVKAGIGVKDFADPAQKSSTDFLVEGEVVYKYREPSQVRLFMTRTNSESTSTVDNTVDKFYVATYGGVEVTHQLNPTLAAKVIGLVGTDDYPDVTTVGTKTAKRSDTVYSVAAAVHYSFRRWLAVEVAYERRVRDSNFTDFSYTENRVKAALVLTY